MKKRMMIPIGLLISCLFISIFAFSVYAKNNLPLNKIQLPPGFSISVYAEHISNARQMALGKNGTVFVGTRGDKVYALPNKNKDFSKADTVIPIASGLNAPNGVAFHNGSLYVAEIDRILRYDDIESRLQHPPKPKVIVDNLPKKSHHGYRYIKFGPDGWLYFGIGAPCNVCIRKDPRFATIMRMRPNGKEVQIYASGVRNTVGFAWDARQKLWFTDNGRDWLGDGLPPDELNYAPRQDMNFGFPYYYGDNVPDPTYGDYPEAKKFVPIPPAYDLPAHVAALGMTFYTGKMFPKKYRQQIFIAEHGSWNRSKKIGYRISLVTLKDNKAVSYKPFATGWLQGQKSWGRPVDTLVLPDGSLLVSDDYANAIYRITYKP